MGLTYGDLARLEQRLVNESAVVDHDDIEPALRDIGSWYSESSENGDEVVDSSDFAALCEHARSSRDPRVRKLALGALIVLTSEGSLQPDRARFAARFALQRIQALTGQAPLWSGVELSASDREDAEALFDAAVGDESYSDAELEAATAVFVSEHVGESGIFGRLASDLAFLLDIIRAGDGDIHRRDTARAALTYFTVISDAIPDDLGLVGFLDDIYVVNRAVCELRPERGSLTSFLDTILSHWPFIIRLAFQADEQGHPLSEYMVVNAALLLEEVREESSCIGTAVLVPDVGPLGFLIGFVRAIAEISSRVSRETHPAFKHGEKLVNRETKKEIEFRSYGRLDGTAFTPGPASDATHFQFVEIKSKKRGGTTVRCNPVEFVYSFQRCSGDKRGKKRGELVLDTSMIAVGPLERLLGTAHPIVLPLERGRVIVVARLGEAENLARTLSLHGVPLCDVFPMGAMTHDGDGYEFKSWTRSGAGGTPMLTIVPRTGDAVELAEDPDANVIAVVSPVRQDTTDAMNLARIASEGVPVIAFVDESDLDAHDRFEDQGFNFWSWDESWYGVLHWPVAKSARTHPVAQLERSIRDRLDSKVEALLSPLGGLGPAYTALCNLEQWAEEDENECIGRFLEDAYRSFLRICRHLAPVTIDWAKSARAELERTRGTIDRQSQWWPGEAIAEARAAIEHLVVAIGELEIRNPKFEMLVGWAQGREGGSVVCSGAMREALEGLLHNDLITLGAIPKGSYVQSGAIIPGWLGRSRMDRLLSPPVATATTLLLYEPEMAWYQAWSRRKIQYKQRFRQIAALRSPFRGLKSVSGDVPGGRIVITPLSACPEEIVMRARRRGVIAKFGADTADLVKARLVYFAGGSWAAFLPKHELPTLTNLVEADVDELMEDDYVKPRRVEDLESGELVLLMRGSGHDAIRAVVDLDPSARRLRERATQWQSALKRYVMQGYSVDQLKRNLEQCGCRRSEATIRLWLESDRIIGPRNGLEDIKAIQKATGDRLLGSNMDDCDAAIGHVRSLHMKAARTLTEKVLSRAKQWLDAGAAPDELVEIEDRLVLVTVESIDPNPIDVPRGIVNQIQEDRWPG